MALLSMVLVIVAWLDARALASRLEERNRRRIWEDPPPAGVDQDSGLADTRSR